MKGGFLARHLLGFAPLAVLGGVIPQLPLPPIDPGPPASSPPPSAPWTGFPAVGQPLFEDSGASSDASSVWGAVDCQEESRVQLLADGDPLPTPNFQPQSGEGFRRLTVLDGDDFYGERCELGRNNHHDSPVALYRERQRRITHLSVRLPNGFPIDHRAWQAVMQMKQSQPSVNGSGSPVLSLEVKDGRWKLFQGFGSEPVWTGRAETGSWTHLAFDVTYSRRASVGSVKVYADLNGDGDAKDHDEESERTAGRTLKREKRGSPPDGVPAGKSIPSHLRVGVYHDPQIPCPPPNGCYIDVDNVGVYTAG